MKKVILILLFIACAITLKAQQVDSTNQPKPEKVFIPVDVEPTFPGGFEKFFHFLKKNVKYPKEDREKNIVGNVRIAFVVEKDGTLTNIRVAQGLSAATDEEAIRVMKLSPKWIPGSAQGKVCRVEYNMPIHFE